MGDICTQVIDKLKSLTDKKFIYFFNSGDDAIFYLMRYFKNQGKSRILITDCGGWFSYKKFPKRLSLDVTEIRTIDAMIDIVDFKSKLTGEGFSIINSMGGYFVEQPMDTLYNSCRENGFPLINDVSASIGRQNAIYGDFCIGSFGKGKPIELGVGGFIGSNIELQPEKSIIEDEHHMKHLFKELNALDNKLSSWRHIRDHIKQDLGARYLILHPDSDGINLVVCYHNDAEKENLINYCDKHKLDYVLCPNYIKVNRAAVSIEIKRGYKNVGSDS